uniref:Uncharacterized protein n=1 Tax=Chaetoceros debilis TaxID=122233 RepID=A0A7S3PX14_9STRA|mmetsp:Transcript_11036/g.16699  ORF Transcript_11036/g.16699 Transcript_11036/m.16699 type:complete len:440 (+) Transcript_11036:46-1365(+)|eukprot:CAMPEP_0194111444 /NCGR_PEP_ID=MMETSP0150-20130528/10431_1 /TAXON_ID=122233 /ORGANISM="Chaetoceros debilis, Strain MM31A-1" /LENGTH=439 /DNA_ID=CAMNT_0038800871 /DNA_START=33 /DNA_END=1352 /DNA_ORIENTATION=-
MAEKESARQSNSNDLVIKDGFAALNTFRLPKIGETNVTEEVDPVPRSQFASFPSALIVGQDKMQDLVHDCELAFTARTKEDSDAYSSGATFFAPAAIKPRCALEKLAMDIFQAHTKGLEAGKHYDLERSGAEWWTLVLDTTRPNSIEETRESYDADSQSSEEEDDEVGMHFDADYGLEHQLPNFMLHPRVATVTYLSNIGVPTLVLDKRSPPPKDIEKKSLGGSIEVGWLSHPMVGKHIAFDGRLLHGAPGTFFPTATKKRLDCEDHEPATKKRKVEVKSTISCENDVHSSTQRITFMVNIWLNHCPIDAELIDDNLCSKMKIQLNFDSGEEKVRDMKGEEIYESDFQFTLEDIDKPNSLEKEEIYIAEEEKDWAGTEEVVICNREVDFIFLSTMEALHGVSHKANCAEGKSLEIKFDVNALQLKVGALVPDSDDEGDE